MQSLICSSLFVLIKVYRIADCLSDVYVNYTLIKFFVEVIE